MKKYCRGGRSGKLHNMARQFRKFKQNSPAKNTNVEKQFLEQLALLQQQYELSQKAQQDSRASEEEITQDEPKV